MRSEIEWLALLVKKGWNKSSGEDRTALRAEKDGSATTWKTPVGICFPVLKQNIMKHLDVVAAVILVDGKILCVQRGKNKYDYISYKYEFPGGKVEKGETKQEALQREIREELKLEITIDKEFLTVEHTYPDFHISLHSYLCSCPQTDLTLTEHIDFKWMSADLIATLDWAEADIAVVDKIVYEDVEWTMSYFL